jgi:hypothetical protein
MAGRKQDPTEVELPVYTPRDYMAPTFEEYFPRNVGTASMTPEGHILIKLQPNGDADKLKRMIMDGRLVDLSFTHRSYPEHE